MLPNEVYARITERIIADLEQGVRPWQKPWISGPSVVLPLRCNGIPYQGFNILILWMEAVEKGYTSPFWLTFNQVVQNGGKIITGERSTTIFYVSKQTVIRNAPEDAEGKEIVKQFMRCYQVFNANQVKNLPKRFYPQAPLLEETIGEGERIPKADRFFAATNAQVIHGYSCAFYSFKSDYIAMPNFTEFKNVHGYYSTLAHEMIHWTGHSTRVNRELTNFADAPLSYAREELIAELGAAFLCADLGLNHEPREDHSQYIGYWIQHLRSDFKAISVAAGIAQKASQYLHSLQESIPEEVKATR